MPHAIPSRPEGPAPRQRPRTAGSLLVRVRYCECDPMGVAHHAAYAPWLEMGRTELLRETGVTYAELEHAGVYLVITRLECRYRRPVFYDDLIEVRTKVVGGSRVKIDHEYEIAISERRAKLQQRPFTDQPVTIASTTLACVGADGRPRELPEWLMAAG